MINTVFKTALDTLSINGNFEYYFKEMALKSGLELEFTPPVLKGPLYHQNLIFRLKKDKGESCVIPSTFGQDYIKENFNGCFGDHHSGCRDTAFIQDICNINNYIPEGLKIPLKDFQINLLMLLNSECINLDRTAFCHFVQKSCQNSLFMDGIEKYVFKRPNGPPVLQLCNRSKEYLTIDIKGKGFYGTTLTSNVRALLREPEISTEWKCILKSFYKGLKEHFYCGISEELIDILFKNDIKILHTSFQSSGETQALIKIKKRKTRVITYTIDDNKSFVESFRKTFGSIK